MKLKLCLRRQLLQLKATSKSGLMHYVKPLLASKIISYAQGFMLMRREASNENGWDLNYGNVAPRGVVVVSSVLHS
ncbi:hypothetical protein OH492_24865 [Vibrio chagasii]|nr:hypothetical protein [Vibrio chagasii]